MLELLLYMHIILDFGL